LPKKTGKVYNPTSHNQLQLVVCGQHDASVSALVLRGWVWVYPGPHGKRTESC